MHSEQVSTLNKIMAMIDEKATEYKRDYMRLPQAKRFANKKLILDLIDNAKELAHVITPLPKEVLDDLGRLHAQLSRLN